MLSEEAILENRKKILSRRSPFRQKILTVEVNSNINSSMDSFESRAYVIYDAVLNLIYLSADGQDVEHLGLFVIGKF